MSYRTIQGSEAVLDASSRLEGRLLVDARMPGMDGLELLRRLKSEGARLRAIMITGQGDVLTVEAMKAGAADFIEKPIGRDEDELVDRPRTQLKAGHLSFLRGFGDQALRRIIITSTKLGTGPRTIPSKILHPLLGARARLTGRRGEHTPTATAN